jgi:hypothetical protein
MKSLAKASRVNIALQVFQHMNNGMTVVEIHYAENACKTA